MLQRRVFLGGVFLSGLLLASPALTQNPLDEMIVTTTRTNSDWLTNPGNISSLPAPDGQLAVPSRWLNRIAGVGIQQNNGQEHLTAIRSPALTGGAGAGSFLFMEDGIAYRAAGFANVNALLDAIPQASERVEVVRGPGSALYGSNAVHGLVNFVSPSPFSEEEKQEIIFDYSAGSFERHQIHATASVAHPDWGARGHISHLRDGGYRDSSGGEQTKLHWQGGWRGAQGSVVGRVAIVNFDQRTAGYLGCEGCERAYLDRDFAQTNQQVEEDGIQPYRQAQNVRGALFATYEVSQRWNMRVRATPYWRVNEMEFLMHFLPGTPTENNEHWSVGMQTALEMEPRLGALILTGVDWEFSRGTLREVQTAPDTSAKFNTPYRQGVHYDYAVNATQFAPFAHIVWPLFARVDAIVGARLEWTRYDYENFAEDPIELGRTRRIPSRVDDYFNASPKAGLNYHINQQWLGFFNYARAARAPQTSDAYRLQEHQVAGEVRSEVLDSLEWGVRRQAGRARFAVSAFFMYKQNFYFRDADGFNVADGRTQHYGFEIELQQPLTEQLELGVSFTYAHHVYDFNRSIDHDRQQAETIHRGDDVDGAPRTLANVKLTWAPSALFDTSLEWEHSGAYAMDASNQHHYPGYNLLHWGARLHLGERVDIYLRVRNLMNAAYATRADFWFGNERYFPGEPLSVAGGIKMKL